MLHSVLPTSSERMDEELPCPAEMKAILPLRVVRAYLHLDGLPNYLVHVRHLGEDGGVLELNAVAQVDAVFGHG
jgi:hypothetical protein